MMDDSLIKKMSQVAEEIYGTACDSNQIPIDQNSVDKLDSLSPDWLKYKLDEKEEPMSWVVIVPTTKEIADKFISKKITERQILELTKPQVKYSALYLCSAITLPEYRNRGLATDLLKSAINSIPKTDDCVLFAWPFSLGGEKLIEKLNNDNIEVRMRTDGPRL